VSEVRVGQRGGMFPRDWYKAAEDPGPPPNPDDFSFETRVEFVAALKAWEGGMRLSRRETFPCPHCNEKVVAAQMQQITPLALVAARGGGEMPELLGEAMRRMDESDRWARHQTLRLNNAIRSAEWVEETRWRRAWIQTWADIGTAVVRDRRRKK